MGSGNAAPHPPPWPYDGRVKWIALGVAGLSLVGSGLVAAAAPASPGDGRVVVQKGIAGLRLGMTRTQVRARVGRPRKVERGTNEIGRYVTLRYRTYSVTFFGGPHVTQMDTRAPNERTAGGIGVGSTRAEVAATVPRVKCLTEFGYNHCYVGIWKPGKAVTDFAIKNGRVTRVSIGYVID